MYKAFLFDLNGTMIDDMHYHLKVWHRIVTELGATLTEAEVKKEMYGKNQDLLIRVFGEGKFTEEEMEEISIRKEKLYQEIYKPDLSLIPGLFEFLGKARKKDILMAIGSAAIPFNINFVLDNLNLHNYFKAIVSATDVSKSKPHPETYLKAAKLIGVDPEECVVFEDAPKGVEAALNAGMKCITITTMHEEHEFAAYPNILLFVKDYNDQKLLNLLE
jgi:beta-phosphoglucomutase family hydrolase